MSTKELHQAFKALGELPNNLLVGSTDDMAKYRMNWAPTKYVNGEKREKNLGQWTDGVRVSPTISLIGMVCSAKSSLDEYGSLYLDKKSRPKRDDLFKAKFNVAITYPSLEAGDQDSDLVLKVNNQMMCLQDIQSAAEKKLSSEGEAEPKSTTDWVRFEEGAGTTQGYIYASLGPVYESSIRRVKGRRDASPLKAKVDPKTVKPDIEQDSENYVLGLENHNLKHNDNLPAFLANGERIGRTGPQLRRELYDGRWVRIDVEMVMWNMKMDNKRIFQLKIVRLEVLPMDVWRSGMTWGDLEASKYGPMDSGASGSAIASVEKGGKDDEGGSNGEETVSEGGDDGKEGRKRKNVSGSEQRSKKAK